LPIDIGFNPISARYGSFQPAWHRLFVSSSTTCAWRRTQWPRRAHF